MPRKLTNILIYTGTFAAVIVWGVASFAQTPCSVDIECQRNGIEARDTAAPEQRLLNTVDYLERRLDGVLRAQTAKEVPEYTGDAKLAIELDSIKTEAQSLDRSSSSSTSSIKGLQGRLNFVENRIIQIERQLSGAQ